MTDPETQKDVVALARSINGFCDNRDMFWDADRWLGFMDVTTPVLRDRLRSYFGALLYFSAPDLQIIARRPFEYFSKVLGLVSQTGRCQSLEYVKRGCVFFWRLHCTPVSSPSAAISGYWPCENWNPGREKRAAAFLSDMLDKFADNRGTYCHANVDHVNMTTSRLHQEMARLFGCDMDLFPPDYFHRLLESLARKGHSSISWHPGKDGGSEGFWIIRR
jgi:hypothetical protein